MWMLTLILYMYTGNYEVHFIPTSGKYECLVMAEEARTKLLGVIAADCDFVKRN